MNNITKHIIIYICAAYPALISAAVPAGYYNSCEGKSGNALLQALSTTVGSHTNVGYDGLWHVYETSDIRPDDGKVWDMYSTKHWTVNHDQCGTYSYVGDCYNREHSFPKSWFSNGAPMVSDAFHIYPTDGKVNGQRSNHPYGECANGSTLPSHNGIRALGRLGSSTFPGYTGTVFEPDDEYKGDFARSYFYMAAAYYDRIANWDSPMLAGNKYPAFSTWALNLLLKWHRQDPVSSKEITRNDAVYAYQHNRNPFIDHPEMVEYIWGNMQSQAWSSTATAGADIVIPADNSTIDMGTVAVNRTRTATFIVKGTGLTSDITLSVNGNGYSVSPSRISATAANSADGARVTISLKAVSAGACNGTITIKAGTITRTVKVTANAVNGLYAFPAKNISDRSFTASWLYVGDDDEGGGYTLHIKDLSDNTEQSLRVNADEGECDIENLTPLTRYQYWITGKTLTSNTVAFTTTGPIPCIQLLYEGTLHPESTSGQRSISYELIVDAENITDDIHIAVSAPFAVSTDKETWSESISIDPENERFYLSLLSDKPGEFTTDITLTSGEYCNNEITISGTVYSTSAFLEDFESDPAGCSTYEGCEYQGNAARWLMKDAGIWESDSKFAHTGKQAVRMGKSADSYIEMLTDKYNGIGRVTLWVTMWSSSDGIATFHLETSTDKGATWQEASRAVTVESESHRQYTFDINITGNARVRIVQTAGKRFIIDDIEISDYTNAGLQGVASDYHSWDAFCRHGQLLIQSRKSQHARVYGIDGIIYHEGNIPAGDTALNLAPGLYIVAIADFTRAVMVK